MKWEYKVDRHSMDGSYTVNEVDNALEIWLNGHGREGWELVRVDVVGPLGLAWIAVFKRPR